MVRVIVASENKGKLKEIKEILKNMPFDVVSMSEAGVDIKIAETGSTFEENAVLKAEAIREITNEIVMADDSGLEVDYLDGAPGIYSARFAGEGATDSDKNRKLLRLLEGVPAKKRTARFVCAIAVAFPGENTVIVRETCEGYIAEKPSGIGGFGYDPLMFIPEHGMTIAMMDLDTKNSISHRGKALRLMVNELKKRIAFLDDDSMFLQK